jgi:hypothetical protein
MSEKQYSLFIPPGELGKKTSRERSPKEARAYYDWLLSVLDQRISDLLAYFGERLTGEAEGDLKRLGGQVAAVVKSPQFSYQDKAEPIVFKKGSRTLVAPPATEMEPRLTNAGYALAADMGLLVAKLLMDVCGTKVKWVILKRPKTDPSCQLPGLTGFGKTDFSPIEVSIADMYGVLRGEKNSQVWHDLFIYCKKEAGC